MNKTSIRNFAVWARDQLIESCKQKAYEYGIKEGEEIQGNVESVGSRILSNEEIHQRNQLVLQINQKGYSQVIEEAAYTWFNRFVALRFMEVNNYLPSKIRVFTDEMGSFKPEILKQAMTVEIDGLDRNKVINLIEQQDNERLYKYLLILQCNALGDGLPYVFEKVASWTELLFPDNLLRSESVIGRLVSDIAIEDWADEVEIIGWLYQYYISKKHDEVVNPLYGKNIKKEDIPAATQLFTTDWVVRYILDNSLGRYWIERHPSSKLPEKLEYLVLPKNGKLITKNENLKPEELKVFDPCVGSGHFLSYAFDVLLEIYRESGWTDRDAAKSIIENNLYGLDIDSRAAQLACFAVMMKARKYNRRIINPATNLHIMAMQESDTISDDLIQYVANHNPTLENDLNKLRDAFINAKEYGSIISIPQIEFQPMYERIRNISDTETYNVIDISLQHETDEQLLPLVQQAEILSSKYEIVVTNPPYLNKYTPALKGYINSHFSDYKGDLFSVFMFRNFDFCKDNGYSGFMTPMVWMFIKTYEPMRRFILDYKSISTLIQFEYSAFEEATVPICSFVMKNGKDGTNGVYFKLSDFKGGMEVQKKKVLDAKTNPDCGYYYESSGTEFKNIPGCPIAYWVSDNMIKAFQGKKLFDYGRTCQGFATGDNSRFLRLWFESSSDNIFWDCYSHEQSKSSSKKWYPCTKGGSFRRWYGNMEYLVNWQNDGRELTEFSGSVIRNPDYYFKRACTWSTISSGLFSMRYAESGSLFESKGAKLFIHNEKMFKYILGIMNGPVAQYALSFLAPTLDYHEGPISKVPIINSQDEKELACIDKIVDENISICKKEWDSYETSWDFVKHPLIRSIPETTEGRSVANSQGDIFGMCPIEHAFSDWMIECDEWFNKLQSNEEKLNQIFIEIYGLQDELSSKVDDKDITVRKANLSREIRSFISYAVGCMFGRYSLDEGGLVYAGGAWDGSKYDTFQPDNDAIIPICDDEYFDDDIVGRFVDFVGVAFGKNTLDDNLRYIADALGGKGTSREVIRNYFINDFYADHVKVYQKRPIYWLFDSGKKNGFKALIYMHRYQSDLLARMRTDYVHEQQERYRTQLQMLEDNAKTSSQAERVKINKQIKKIQDQMAEIRIYEEKIHHLADQMIEIDLDDGVKANYAKFQDVLAKIK